MPVIIVPNLIWLDITGKIPTEIPEFMIGGRLVLLYMLVYLFLSVEINYENKWIKKWQFHLITTAILENWLILSDIAV